MPNTSLADRIRAEKRSRSPVRDTVKRLYAEIHQAVLEGLSYRDIHERLTREGHAVGRNHTSLFTAYKAVSAARETELNPSPNAGAVSAASERASPTPSSTAATAPVSPLTVVDTRRNTNDW